MANAGDRIDGARGKVANVKTVILLEDQLIGPEDVYFYISGQMWTTTITWTLRAGKGTLFYQYWNGSSWVTAREVDLASYAGYVFEGSLMSYISRFLFSSRGLSFGTTVKIEFHGYSYFETYYKHVVRGSRIARVADGKQCILLGGQDCKPTDSAVSSIYDTTQFRGQKITTDVPLCCFVAI